jgi:anti-sigma factor ChrR (cupin superfamily)
VSANSFVDANALEWRDTPCAGVRWKKLHFDSATGESAVLLRFEPGASYDAHRHPRGEQYLVLEGELDDGGRRYGPMTYVHHAPGSAHRPTSPTGALVFVVLAAPIEPLSAS